MNNINIFNTPGETAQNLGDYLVRLIENDKKFNIALSGGSTPRYLFDYLADQYSEYNFWQNIHFYWSDERCVPADDTESNYGMTRKHLFDKIEIPNENIHRILGENNPADEAIRYEEEIKDNLLQENYFPSFDLIILGMGDDGHTASIFPHQLKLVESQNICEVAVHPISGQKRITLTGKVINNAKEVIFFVAGEDKKKKLTEILNETEGWRSYPASYIKPPKGKLNWFIDKAAAGLL